MTIEKSATKGYIGYIRIEVYHNENNIDFDSIQEAYNQDIIILKNNEESLIKEVN